MIGLCVDRVLCACCVFCVYVVCAVIVRVVFVGCV